MEITILTATILISDQYGITREDLIGVFDDPLELEKARDYASKKHSNTIFNLHEKVIILNSIA